MAELDKLLSFVKERNGSDLHLTSGGPPRYRQHGVLKPIPDYPDLTDEHVRHFLREICPDRVWSAFERQADVDFAYEVKGLARFRANLFDQEYGMGAVFRLVPEKIIPLRDLAMPKAIEKLAHLEHGLVLVTGPTGSGKSTTLAAIIDMVNRTYAKHIVTIEDPVEFVHPNRKSVLSHREVGQHTKTFAAALRSAMRQDADVILVGEMRDHETISLALAAASMGVLVFGTLHTNSAAKTVDRLVDAFPTDEQGQARAALADSLVGVVSQLLLATRDGHSRVASVEILLRTPGLANIIREGKTSMIANVIQAGRGVGMQTMDDSLFDLVQGGKIQPREGHRRAAEKGRFEPFLQPR